MVKNFKRKFKKRRYRRRTPLYRNSMGLGNKLVRKTRYVEKNIVLNPSIGGLADSYVFSANGLYDPNVSGAGHQPIGFDQIMNFYDHYVVLGSKITVRVLNGDTTNSMICGVTLQDNATEVPNATRLIENGRCKWTQLAAANTSYAGSSVGPKTLVMKCNPNKFLGRSKPLADSQLKGSASSNPTEQAYWHVFAEPNTTADGGSVQLHVVLDYLVAYIEPKTLIQS